METQLPSLPLNENQFDLIQGDTGWKMALGDNGSAVPITFLFILLSTLRSPGNPFGSKHRLRLHCLWVTSFSRFITSPWKLLALGGPGICSSRRELLQDA